MEDLDNHRRPLGGSLSRVDCRPHPFVCNFINVVFVIIFINIIVQITLFSQRVGFHLPPFGQLLSGVVIVIIVYIIIVIITSFNHDIHCDHPNRHTDHRLVRREYWVALQLPEKNIICSVFTKKLSIETFAPDFSFG